MTGDIMDIMEINIHIHSQKWLYQKFWQNHNGIIATQESFSKLDFIKDCNDVNQQQKTSASEIWYISF